ncbi:hypothetical protein [Iningainema tapete]|uniref:Uncharacterized protein n=1 Tax=Iningainema tapete BLCC-T55 TaxID=2748662 RepID=A0A8J6XNZ7_9CYAN|nr:hypothetical protein [Iningainema tapete]MBD2776757.1 hypothetical protein [Iningainema tapete BLCC-T55]
MKLILSFSPTSVKIGIKLSLVRLVPGIKIAVMPTASWKEAIACGQERKSTTI